MKRHVTALIIILLWLAACSGPATESKQSVRPGDTVPITLDELELTRGMNLTVTVGGVMSRYVNITEPHVMEIGIPLLPKGEAKVEVRSAGKVFEGPTYDVAPLPLMSITIFVTGDSTMVVDSEPTDEPLPLAPALVDVRRISYDFFSEDGIVWFLSTIPHPQNEAAGTDGDYQFHVVIPQVDRGILRIFEAHAGLDINVGHNAHHRKLLGEFILPLDR